jgi:TetR/AcrR family transcriptional regulator, cholesterol catabolism regulator
MSEDKNMTKSEQTRTRILDAAARTFRQVGYSAASLRDIAEQAGMQAGSLYYHFANKEQLAEEVMKAGVDGSYATIKAAVARLPKDAGVLDKMEAAFAAHLSYMLDQSDYAVAMMWMLRQTPEPIRERTLVRQRSFGRFFASLFEKAEAEGLIKPGMNLSALRMLIFGAMNWTPEWYSETGLTPQQLATHLRRLIER